MAAVIEHQQPRGAASVTNSGFLHELAGGAPRGTALWVTAFAGSPDLTNSQNWFGQPFGLDVAVTVDSWTDRNTYFSVAALRPTGDGEIRRRKVNFSRLLALVVDDVNVEDVPGPVSYVLATSPGKVQVGILIDGECQDAADIRLVDRLVTSMAERGMMRADISGNNAVRYVRLPVGQNQKPREQGVWQHELRQWSPSVRLSLDDAAAAFGLDLDELRESGDKTAAPSAGGPQDERLRVLTSNVIRGDGLHDTMNQIAASLVASGATGGAVVNLLRGLMDASLAPKDERWLARYNDIPRSVTTAQEKFGRSAASEDSDDEQASEGLALLSIDELDAASKRVTWAIKHILPADSVGLIFGAPGTFKSFIALDMALHIAHGMPWLGKKTKKGSVIYLAAEGGTGLMKRIRAWHMTHGMVWDGIDFRVITVPVMLSSNAEAVVEAAKATGVTPSLIVVDTKSQTDEGEENSSTDTANYFRQLGTCFRALWACTVLVIHHSGHSATERPRGSSAILGNVDFMFGVFRDAQQMLATLECMRQKDVEFFAPANFDLMNQVVGKDEDGEPINSLVATHINTTKQLLSAISNEGKAGRSGHNGLLMGLAVSGMSEKELRNLFYSELTGKEPDAKRQAWYRALRWAVENRLIEVAQGVVIVLAQTKETK